MDIRRIFGTIPDQFDRWRPRYCDEVFNDLIKYAKINKEKMVLEIGPGTGQATEPMLKTGCCYTAIELDENLAKFVKKKFDNNYNNFNVINNDFETYDFGTQKFDLIYSAATIQWIPEEIAFQKVFTLLKNEGVLAMMMTCGEYKTSNTELYYQIQKIYDEYFHPEIEYKSDMTYTNVVNHGFINFECKNYIAKREFTANEYVSYIGTHSDHIILREPYKTSLFEGIRDAIRNSGNRIILNDTIKLYLALKP